LEKKIMAKQKRHSPEEIVAKLRQVDVLTGQGKSIAEAIRVSPVSTRETFLTVSRTEDFWFIAAARSEDETEIRAG
jgi:crotonobetainyl-CoA:carnitine CoA-transferase CaiB-like acyl-CoA transferase